MHKQSFVELRTQQKSVELAQQNYQVVSNRYNNQLALITDMIDASNIKLNVELQEVNARINIAYTYFCNILLIITFESLVITIKVIFVIILHFFRERTNWQIANEIVTATNNSNIKASFYSIVLSSSYYGSRVCFISLK